MINQKLNVFLVRTMPRWIFGLFMVVATVGAHAQLVVSPSTVNFADTEVGKSSPGVTVKLTNESTTPITLNGPPKVSGSADNYFVVVATTCTSLVLQAKASCQILLGFRPQKEGTFQNTITIAYTGAAAGSATVTLNGRSISSTQQDFNVSLNRSQIDFGTVKKDALQPTQTLVMRNIGSGSVTVSAPVLSGDGFVVTSASTCATTGTASLAVGASCTYVIGLKTQTVGVFTGGLGVVVQGETQNIPLKGTVESSTTTQTPGNISLSETNLEFGSIEQNSTTQTKTVTVTNDSFGTVTLKPPVVSGANSVIGLSSTASTCGIGTMVLTGRSSCTYVVSVNPITSGDYNLSVTVSDGTTSAKFTAKATVTPSTNPPISPIRLSDTALSFGQVLLNSATQSKTLTVTNVSGAALTLNAPTFTGVNAVVGLDPTNSTCGTAARTLSVGASCTYVAVLKPSATGNYSLGVTVSTGQTTEKFTVQATVVDKTDPTPPGTVDAETTPAASLEFSQTSIRLQTTNRDTRSPIAIVVVKNPANRAAFIRAIAIPAPFYDYDGSCKRQAFLMPQESCTIEVFYLPKTDQTEGQVSGEIDFQTIDGSSKKLALMGSVDQWVSPKTTVTSPPPVAELLPPNRSNDDGGGCTHSNRSNDAALFIWLCIAIGLLIQRNRTPSSGR